jgi:hypothetical protein
VQGLECFHEDGKGIGERYRLGNVEDWKLLFSWTLVYLVESNVTPTPALCTVSTHYLCIFYY